MDSDIDKRIQKTARRAARLHGEAVEALKSATPIHPETGERGTFVRFAGGGTRIRPVYQTPSGKEFFVD